MSTPYQQLRELALSLGWEFKRQGKGDHERWWHPVTRKHTTIPAVASDTRKR